MTEINFTSLVLGFFVFVFILLSSTLLITTGFSSYDISDNNSLEQFDSAKLQGNLSDLGYELDSADATLSVEEQQDGWIAGVSKLLNKIKAIKGIRLTLQETMENVLTFIPDYVWWLLGSIVAFIIVMITIAAWLRWKP